MANYYRNREQPRRRGHRSDGDSDHGREENYFGGGMQYGEGYRDRHDDGASYYDRPSRSYPGGFETYQDRETGRRQDDNERRREQRPGYDREDDLYAGPGFWGMSGYGSDAYGSRFGGHGGESFGRYRSGYPDSERGYSRQGNEEERGWWDRTSDEVASWFGDEEAERRREMDYRRDGGYRGRGPRGYKRSDDRIKEDINDRLTDNSHIDASDIEVEVDGGDVTLTGHVENRYEKRMAADLAEDVSGVKNVANQIRVNNTGRGFYADRSIAPSVRAAEPPESTSDATNRRSKPAMI